MRMRWTPGNVARLREFAASGMTMRATARKMNCTRMAINKTAVKYRISFHGKPCLSTNSPPGDVRQRWVMQIGPMKAALRAECERIIASEA